MRKQQAIAALLPNVEWIMKGEQLVILTPNIEMPTNTQIEEKLQELISIEQQKNVEAKAARAALLAKLGITEEEAKLLLS